MNNFFLILINKLKFLKGRRSLIFRRRFCKITKKFRNIYIRIIVFIYFIYNLIIILSKSTFCINYYIN